MLTDYIARAMGHAHYEIMENGRFWGEIPGLQGLWADGEALEQCRQALQEALEAWLIVGFRHGHDIPVVDGIDLNEKAEASAH